MAPYKRNKRRCKDCDCNKRLEEYLRTQGGMPQDQVNEYLPYYSQSFTDEDIDILESLHNNRVRAEKHIKNKNP